MEASEVGILQLFLENILNHLQDSMEMHKNRTVHRVVTTIKQVNQAINESLIILGICKSTFNL
jgi:hypothetical protein